MVHVNGLEVVKVRAVLKSPSVRQVRFLESKISVSLVFNGLKISFLRSFCCSCCLLMVVLPLFWFTTFSCMTFFYDAQWIRYDASSILDFLCLFKRGHKTFTTPAVMLSISLMGAKMLR